MKKTVHFYWALSHQFNERMLLGKYCWYGPKCEETMRIAIFRTRKLAREAQKTCCYSETRVEKVYVTVKVVV